MGLTQIGDVHIVSDEGAIRRVLIAPKHADVEPTPRSRLQHQRNQVRFGLVALAQLPFWVSPRSV
jgi:hypothetical protein